MDDEAFTRETIRAVLRPAGRSIVTEAGDGDAALVMAEKSHPDVVPCDITMPRLGLRFVEQLRKHPEARMRDTPVIILTSHAEKATVTAASKPRVNRYLIKPISSKQLRPTPAMNESVDARSHPRHPPACPGDPNPPRAARGPPDKAGDDGELSPEAIIVARRLSEQPRIVLATRRAIPAARGS